MEQRLTLITLGVDDIARARRFYVDGLKWRPGLDTPEVVFLQLGGVALALWGRRQLADDARLPLGSGFGGIALAHNVRSKAEVDATIADAIGAGARLLKPAHDTEWGGYSGYFADPDGHPWEVAWNPAWKLLEDGSVRI